MDHEKTGRYIAACRKKKKMTQKDLADRLGVTNKAVSKWETGQGMPDISALLELARVLDVPVEAILEGGPAETETVQPALQEYTTPSGVMEHPEKKERSRYVLEGVGGILLVLGILCLGVQIWYILNRDGYQIEYMARWMFFAVNGAAHLFLMACGLCMKKLRPFFLKPAVVLGAVLLFAGNGAAGLLTDDGQREILSFSPGFPSDCMVLKIQEDNGSARLYRQAAGPFVRQAETFPFTVAGEVKTQWLEKDVCAVTYESEEDGGVHQYVATYGDRSDGTAYYYVSNAIAGTWVGEGGYMLDVRNGQMELETPRGVEIYEYDAYMQYGTLSLVFPKNGPEWTLVLNADCILEGGENTVEDGGTLTLCRVSMKKTTPVVLERIMDGDI